MIAHQEQVKTVNVLKTQNANLADSNKRLEVSNSQLVQKVDHLENRLIALQQDFEN